MGSPVRESFSYPLNIPGIEKSIWGPTWQAFMGMSTDEGGVNPIADQPADYTRARTAESYVYRCDEVRGKAISKVPLKAWTKSNAGKMVAVDHDSLDVLSTTNPYGWVDGPQLLRATLSSLDFHGRSAWKLAFNRKKIPTEIYWIIPTQFTPLSDPKTFFGGIRWTTEGGVQEIPASQLCYFKTDSLDNPLYGTSKIAVLRNAINLRAYSQRSNIDFFKNSQRPDMIVTGEWNNTSENMQRLRREWRQAFSGEANKSPFFAGNNTKATLLTLNNKDMEWLAQQRLSQEEISATFGVPLIYLNNYDRATYDNIKVAKIILWHDTMMPEGDNLAGMFTRQFLWRFWPETRNKITLGFDYDEIEGLGEDLALIWERVRAMSEQISTQVKNRELTPDQARALRTQLFQHIGIDTSAFTETIPGGGILLEQFGFLPLGQHSVQALMNVEASRSSSPLAAELIEDVPGAPNAGKNAARIVSQNQQQLDQEHQDRVAAVDARAAAPAPKAANSNKALRLVRGPDPQPIRDARLGPIQTQLERRLKKHFQGLKNQAERILRGDAKFLTKEQGPIDPNQDLYDSQQNQQDLVDLIVSEGILVASSQAFDSANKDFGLDVSWPGAGDPDIAAYVTHRVGLIKGIDTTLRNELRRVIQNALSDQATIPQLADEIRQLFQNQIDSKSKMIARTETMQAYAAASLAAYRRAGIDQVKMYDGDNDDIANCDVVDGMVVTLAEAAQLMSQEHPNGTRGVSPIVDLHLLGMPQEQVLGPGIRLVA